MKLEFWGTTCCTMNGMKYKSKMHTCGAALLLALAPAEDATPSLPPGGAEPVDASAAAAEAVILGLRLDDGVPSTQARTGPLGPHLDWAFAAGLVHESDAPDGPRVRLTTAGRLLSNELFARLV